jgi:hypothetical protein
VWFADHLRFIPCCAAICIFNRQVNLSGHLHSWILLGKFYIMINLGLCLLVLNFVLVLTVFSLPEKFFSVDKILLDMFYQCVPRSQVVITYRNLWILIFICQWCRLYVFYRIHILWHCASCPLHFAFTCTQSNEHCTLKVSATVYCFNWVCMWFLTAILVILLRCLLNYKELHCYSHIFLI